MALPRAQDARMFYRSARQRLGDGEFLFAGGRATGAMYIAGYAVECILKALILSVVSATKRNAMLDAFRGSKAHDFGWLKMIYFQNGGAGFPREYTSFFTLVSSWSTEWRYEAGSVREQDAKKFLDAVRQIVALAEMRF